MKEKLYITNYCDRRCTPFNSITTRPKQEAYDVAKELSQYTGTSFTSFSRFCDEDFDGYYKKRVCTEKWLYDSFVALGGEPKNVSPLYFVIGKSDYLDEWFEKGIKTTLLLEDIDIKDVSFTYGDSMAWRDSPHTVKLFDKESLFEFIYQTTEDVSSFLDNLNKQNRYIEVQLWNDEYLDYLKK